MKQHVNENRFVVTLQNGISEPAIREVIGKNRVVGCPVG